MAYDEYLADRIKNIIQHSGMPFFTKKMMGGLIFMVNEKMACGTHYDKKHELDLLMVRIGEDALERNKDRLGYMPMSFTGRPMRGYAWVSPDGFDSDEDLEYWIGLCLDFNPQAKASKKRKKKTD